MEVEVETEEEEEQDESEDDVLLAIFLSNSVLIP